MFACFCVMFVVICFVCFVWHVAEIHLRMLICEGFATVRKSHHRQTGVTLMLKSVYPIWKEFHMLVSESLYNSLLHIIVHCECTAFESFL
jgi:hypothetical protein